jgi:hypothetical protein
MMTNDPNETADPEITKQVSVALDAFNNALPDTLRTYHVIGILVSIIRNFTSDSRDAADLMKDLLLALAESYTMDEQSFGPDTDECMCSACVAARKAQAH